MLRPKLIDKNEYVNLMKAGRANYKTYYDMRTKIRAEFNEDDHVYYQEKPRSQWKRAVVMEKEHDRTYKILTEEGRVLRRNKQFLIRRRWSEQRTWSGDKKRKTTNK